MGDVADRPSCLPAGDRDSVRAAEAAVGRAHKAGTCACATGNRPRSATDAAFRPWRRGQDRQESAARSPGIGRAHADSMEISEARLRGRESERFGVCPPVVLGQDFAGLAGLVRDGAVTDLTARDREMRNRHGEAAGA